MRFLRVCALVVLLPGGLLAAMPGVAEVVETVFPDGDCARSCPGDNPEGDCPSSCDQCNCCPRAMSAMLIPTVEHGASRRIDRVAPAIPFERPLVLARGVFRPPRA